MQVTSLPSIATIFLLPDVLTNHISDMQHQALISDLLELAGGSARHLVATYLPSRMTPEI
jgi:hypothetical protein